MEETKPLKEWANKCFFCQIPVHYLYNTNLNDHIQDCREFDRKGLKGCPKNMECDCNTEGHFLRFNHGINRKEPKRRSQLSTPTSSRKRRSHPSTPSSSSKKSKSASSYSQLTPPPSDVKKESLPVSQQPQRLKVKRKLEFDPCQPITLSSDEENQNKQVAILPGSQTPIKKQTLIHKYFPHSPRKVETFSNKNITTVFENNTLSTIPSSVNVTLIKVEIPPLENYKVPKISRAIMPQIEKTPPVDSKTVKRSCPFYKKIRDTSIAVDAFSYGSIPSIKFYFLSHFHYDHYMGLTKKFPHKVYCSKVTANMVKLNLRIPESQIVVLPMEEVVVINCIQVVLLDANHCPGSVMFLFKLPNGTQCLHTGDFRATHAMEGKQWLIPKHIDLLYLDTTYMNPKYTFPSQECVLDQVKVWVKQIFSITPQTLFVCGAYTIGKEKVFMAIAQTLKLKIYGSSARMKTLQNLQSEEIKSLLEAVPTLAQVHLLPMKDLNFSFLKNYLQKYKSHFSQIVAMKPTGWEFKNTSNDLKSIVPFKKGPITIYGVPYSEHSSFKELKQFIQYLQPTHIIPTVNVGNKQVRDAMQKTFKFWKANLSQSS